MPTTTPEQLRAGVIALANRFAGTPQARTIRFVLFPNEEPPLFQTEEMGSLIYAKACRAANDNIVAMMSLETIGYYRDEPGTQEYPPLIGSLFPSSGNFIAFVSNAGSRGLLLQAVAVSRERRISERRPGTAEWSSRRRLVGPLVVLASGVSGDHGDGHGAVPKPELPPAHRHAGHAGL